MASSIAILLLAHGTPNASARWPSTSAKVTGGRPLPADVVAELQHRYSEIGLRDEPGTRAAAPHPLDPPPRRRLLEEASKPAPMPSTSRMRNWHPFIADIVAQMRADGVTRVARPLPRPAELAHLNRPLPPRADGCASTNRAPKIEVTSSPAGPKSLH